MRKDVLPETKLQGLWRVLDENSSGFVDTGELGRFMKIGKPEDGPSARKAVVARNVSTKKLVRSETDRKIGRDLTRKLTDQPRASEEEVAKLCELFNAAQKRERPEARHFFRLFKAVDTDGAHENLISKVTDAQGRANPS